MNNLFLPLLTLVLSLLVTCSNNSGGIGHEGEAIISGSVVYKESPRPLAGLSVYLHTENFARDIGAARSPRTPDALTDDSGCFSLPIPDSGAYLIEINDGNKNAASVRCTVTSESRHVALSCDTMRTTGSIDGKLFLDNRLSSGLYVFTSGLDRIALLDTKSDSFHIEDVPRGVYSLSLRNERDSLALKIISAVTVESSHITDLGYLTVISDSALYSTIPIGLNTTATGVPITQPLHNIPLLVRLSEDNFDFSAAAPDGAGIYFTKPDNTPLTSEIEAYDASDKSAVIWVLVDTLFPDDSEQSMLMHCNSSATSRFSKSNQVFDTAAGFQGIWHLGEQPSDTVRDATLNGFFGIPYGMDGTQKTPGRIGFCQQFNGIDNYIAMPTTTGSNLNFPENSSFSVSAWVFIDSLTSNYQTIVSKSNQLYSIGLSDENVLEFFEFEKDASWKTNKAAIHAGEWVLVTAVCQDTFQYLYLNDQCVDSSAEAIGGKMYRVTTDPVTIGKRTSSSVEGWFKGKVDEVRILNRARSKEWIKICYYNQLPQNKLIQFTKPAKKD